MTYTLTDYWLYFEEVTIENRLSAGTRSVYYALLGEMNRRRFPKETAITVRGLQDLAGLKSVASVHECLNVLKMRGLIAMRKDGGRLFFKLGEPNTKRTLSEQLPNSKRTTAGVLNMRASEDIRQGHKTEDTTRAREEAKVYGKDAVCGYGEEVDWNRYLR